MSGETGTLDQLGSCSLGSAALAPWTWRLPGQAPRARCACREGGPLPLPLPGSKINCIWRLIRNFCDMASPMPGELGRSSSSVSCEPLSFPCLKRRKRTLPSLPGRWLPKARCLPPKVAPTAGKPGQLHCGLCTSGDPQWSVWDLCYCRPNAELSPERWLGSSRVCKV